MWSPHCGLLTCPTLVYANDFLHSYHAHFFKIFKFFASVGPVHFHNPGTVIFSLLSQFTGQVGPTVEAERRTAETDKYEVEEEEERDCPVFHPTSSPSVHPSEEERSSESDSIFFPCQEQGKDCHVSKEEALWFATWRGKTAFIKLIFQTSVWEEAIVGTMQAQLCACVRVSVRTPVLVCLRGAELNSSD